MTWQDKVVMITGASSGIGRGLAIELGKRGALIGVLARRKDLLDGVVSEIESQGGQALSLPTNVQDAAALTASEVAEVIGVNVIGVANCVTAVAPEMAVRGSGQLVAISSLAAYRGLPKSAAYCASKAAVSALFESFRLDLRPRGIDVTIIHPGFIKTPLTAGRQAEMPFLMELDDAVEKIIRAIEKRRQSYAFPWQLATIVRLGMIMPNFMYDRISSRNSFRE